MEITKHIVEFFNKIVMRYNNIENQLKTFAKFVFIYESVIKQMTRETDFKVISANAFHIFKFNLQKKMRYTSDRELKDEDFSDKHTLLFTKSKVQILDFCRHLRNSICHGIISRDKSKLNILDKYRGKETSKGFLDYKLSIEFIVNVIKDFEEKNVNL